MVASSKASRWTSLTDTPLTWRLPDDQTAEALPKYDKAKEVPVWDGNGWVVTPLSFFEPEPEPEPEPSILDPDNLIKAVIALIDAVEKQEPIPEETKTLVEAERRRPCNLSASASGRTKTSLEVKGQ